MCPKKDGDARTSINVKRCNSTTKVQYNTEIRKAYKSNARTKKNIEKKKRKERQRPNTKVQHAYNKDYHLYNIENMQGKIQSVCIWMSVCL